jgi:hypothetical protein
MNRYSIRSNPKSFVDSTIHFQNSQVRLIKAKQAETAERFKVLSNLFYDTFVGDLRPVGGPRAKARPDLFFHAKPYIRELARVGGEDYTKALTALRYAYIGETAEDEATAYRDAVQSVIPPLN